MVGGTRRAALNGTICVPPPLGPG